MKILNRLTIKHLLMNKKRTIVTIIGITLSMALMLGCGLLASSFIEQMRRDTIESVGSHHVNFENVNYDQANIIKNNINVENSYFYSTLGFANFTDSINEGKPYFYIAGANDKLLSSLKLSEGRLPENDSEVVISEHIIYNGGKEIQVGDMLSLEIGSRYQEGEEVFENVEYLDKERDYIKDSISKKYQVVGKMKRSYLEDYHAAGYTIFTKINDYVQKPANYVLVEFYKPKRTFEIGKEIKETLSLKNNDIDYNDRLLYYYGTTRYSNVNHAILSVLSIALSLLSIGCIIVIYNSFAISTMERKKQFGLYSSIGATKKQILHTVFFEAFLVGTIGIILGIAGSFLGIYTVLQILNYLLKNIWQYEFSLVINWTFILVPIAFMILVVFFSAFIPARRSSRVTPIVAIRENDDIKMPKRKLKTPKFITKLFGIEGELALKNMKRNKKKYRITVLSLFVSIVLFISFSAYITYGVSTMNSVDYYDMDITIGAYEKGKLEEIRKDPRFSSTYLYMTDYITLQVPFTNYVDEYLDYRKERISPYEKEDYLQVDLFVFSDEEFQNYATSVNASKNDIIFINEGQITRYNDGNRKSYHGNLLKEMPNEFSVCQLNSSGEDYDCSLRDFNLVDRDQVPITFQYLKYSSFPSAFISKSKYEELFQNFHLEKQEQPFYILHANSSEYETIYQELKDKAKTDNYNVSSPKMELKEQKNALLAIKILLYGFISLVTLIGVTSVFNTIHTSINLRRKEFAMLRSMGLSPSGFNKMILFESLFFGLKSLLYGLPVSFGVILLIHNNMVTLIDSGKILIPWNAIFIACFGVFTVVLLAMVYSVHKIKKENILEAIRDENI